MLFLLPAGLPGGHAQVQGNLGKRFFDNWSVGIGGGPAIFFGDLKANRFIPATDNMNEIKYGGTFMLTRQLSHIFALRGQFLYCELSGTRHRLKYGAPYEQYFTGNILGGNLNVMVSLSNLLATHEKPHRKFFLYLTAGVGATSWNSKVRQLGTGELLRRNDTLGRWSTAFSGMTGIGAYVSIHEKVNLGLELADHIIASDKVDATIGESGADSYVMLSFNITYNFNRYNPGKAAVKPAPVILPAVIPPAPQEKPADTATPIKQDTTTVSAPVVPAPPPPDSSETRSLPQVTPEKDVKKTPPVAEKQEGVVFRVQVYAFRTDRYTAQQIRDQFLRGEEVYRDVTGGWFRFYVGAFRTPEEAKQKQMQLQKQGYKNAFIVKFRNGLREPLK